MHALAIRSVVPSLVLVVVVWYAIRVDARRAADLRIWSPGSAKTCSRAGTRGGMDDLDRHERRRREPVVARLFRGLHSARAGESRVVATLLRALLFWVAMALCGYPSGLGTMHLHEALFAGLLNAAIVVVAMLAARRYRRLKTVSLPRGVRPAGWRLPVWRLVAFCAIVVLALRVWSRRLVEVQLSTASVIAPRHRRIKCV